MAKDNRPNLIAFEKQLWKKGHKHIAGIDEVGRGSLAGPMVVCAAILNKDHLSNLESLPEELKTYQEIKDSKKISPKKRRRIRDFILGEVISYSFIEVSNSAIDRDGIIECTKKAFSKAIKKLDPTPHHVLTDNYEVEDLAKQSQTNLARGDNKSITIAAASILAKVYRDGIMIDYHHKHNKYKVYRFDKHKGYGTALHREMIKKHGHSDLHRKTFKIS